MSYTGTIGVVRMELSKPAALLFDHIWVIPNLTDPSSEPVPNSVQLSTWSGFVDAYNEMLRARIPLLHNDPSILSLDAPSFVCKVCADAFNEVGANAIPLYPTEMAFRQDFQPGAALAYQVA